MRYLIDTGVLLRLFDQTDAEHPIIRQLFRQLRQEGHSLCTTAQNIAEFWNVSTRPTNARGGYGQGVDVTDRRVRFLERLGVVISDHPDAYHNWRQIVVQYAIQGVSVHDARIAAVMQTVSISTIVTLNPDDFSRYAHVDAKRPSELLSEL